MHEIIVVGATLSGNKGAAAMLQSGLYNISQSVDNVKFSILSIYPEEDRVVNTDPNINIVPAKPFALLLSIPAAYLRSALNKLRIQPGFFSNNKIVNAIDRGDLFIDMSGISFSDGRILELGYNVACILPAIILRKPVIKYSQALGPFETYLNRIFAMTLLPKLRIIAARGNSTHEFLNKLGLQNVILCADAAFSLPEVDAEDDIRKKITTDSFGNREIVGISASSVVNAYCEKKGIDYCKIMARFSDVIINTENYAVRLIAHAVRDDKKGGRTNDIDTCKKIYDLMEKIDYCQLIIDDYSPSELRSIIGESSYFIASRFHSMVFALSKNIPVIVTAWSHKYQEVLAMFDLEYWAMEHQDLTTSNLLRKFETLVIQKDEIKTKISIYLPQVIDSSSKNAKIAISMLMLLKK